MTMYALPVTNSDITALQQGILFTTTNATDVANQVSAINANAPGATRDRHLLRQSIARQWAKYIAGDDGRVRADDRGKPVDCDADQLRDEPRSYSVICQFCGDE